MARSASLKLNGAFKKKIYFEIEIQNLWAPASAFLNSPRIWTALCGEGILLNSKMKELGARGGVVWRLCISSSLNDF